MNQLLASIRLMNDLGLIWIQSHLCVIIYAGHNPTKFTLKYGVKCKILPISHL